jgi:serine/threonine protein kinase/Tfp pilus assembly protein PilF
MTLRIGERIGPYEVVGKLGEGGMGIVYQAKDSHLGRDVALKVLPEGFAADPERTARFEREARVLASLNHPNIAQIYGLEVSGDLRALVMELVEGPTLAERLESRVLSLNESLSVARKIADALEEAHEKGVVHRDLKPQNVKVSLDGRVKVLDFGLAKAADSLAGATSAEQLANSPTVTFGGTREGVILGTAAYMAPEQARGKAVDRRADIWAFGVVLYEMLTGERLFVADSVVETLGAVLHHPIDLERLPPATPDRVRELLRRCLERDPRRRLRDIGEARVALEANPVARVVEGAPRADSSPSGAGLSRLPSVAVLPFRNMSADPENEFFADGITEDVIAHLAKIKSIKAISRTSVMQFKRTDLSLREIGERLGAAHLVEGSVRRAGQRVRIVAQLIDGVTDENVWAETYDRDLTDVFAIQSDVALSIVDALRAELSPAERKRVERRPTDDLEAYELFLRGRAELHRFTAEGFRRALSSLERAVARDPGFALAHATIAQIHVERAIQGAVGASPEDSLTRAKESASRALELDPELGDAHGIAGLIHFTLDFDWERAERDFVRALELSPGIAEIHDHYSWLCNSVGRYSDALREVRRAHELDPTLAQSDIATTLLRAERYTEALAEAKRNLAALPDSSRCHSNLGWALIFNGEPQAGLAELERAVENAPSDTMFLAQLGQAAAMTGDRERARSLLSRLREIARHDFVSPYHFAYVHTGLGEKDAAIDWLEQAFERRSGAIYGIKGSFLFRELHGHPRFEALLRRMNL